MNLLKTVTAALALTLGLASLAQARTFHDEVTFIRYRGQANYPFCVTIQTVATGGVKGIDNRTSTGDTGASGFTGGATELMLGTGPVQTLTLNSSVGHDSSGTVLGTGMIVNSRYSPGLLLIDYDNLGANTSNQYTAWCPTNGTIIDGLGQ